MKKRILSVLLATLMVIGSVGTFAIGTSAYEGFTIALEAGEIKDGTVDVDLIIANNPGFAGLDLKVHYDNTKLQLASYDKNENKLDGIFDGMSNVQKAADLSALSYFTYVAANFLGDDLPATNGKLMGVTFNVIGDFESTDLTIEIGNCSNSAERDLKPTVVEGSIGLPEIEGLTFEGAKYTYDGQPKNLAVAGNTAGMTIEYDVKDAVDAAEYTVTATAKKAGYRTWTAQAKLVIEPKELTVSGLDAIDKTYDATNKVTLDTSAVTLVGVVAGDDVRPVVGAEGTTANANAGANLAVDFGKVTLEGADKANYTVKNPSVTVDVDTLKVTVTPKAGQSKKLGENDPAFEYTTSVDVTTFGAEITGELSRVQGEDAGEISKDYAITIGTLACNDANIELVFTEGVMFTIHAKEIQEVDYNAPAASYTFGDGEFDIAAVVTKGTTNVPQYSSSDNNVVTVDANGKVTIVGAGTATVTVIVEGDDTYAKKTIQLAFNVNAKKVTVTPIEGSAVYGDKISVGYTVEGAEPSVVAGAPAVASNNAGEQDITKGTLAVADKNYELVFVTGKKFTITPKDIDVTVELWPTMEGKLPEVKTDSTPVVDAADLVTGDSVTVMGLDAATVALISGNKYAVNGLTSSNPNYNLVATGTAEAFTATDEYAEAVDEIVGDVTVEVAPNATTLDLTDINNSLPAGLEIKVVGSDNEEVVDAEGNIILPESEATVNVTLEYYYNGVATGVKTTTQIVVPAVKSQNMLQMLILYYHKKNQQTKTVESVKASVATGSEVVAGTKVALSTATAGATIYYTVDSSTPTVLSKVYTGPITVNSDMTVSAIAVRSGMKTSAPVSFKYTIDNDYIELKDNAANIKYMDGYADGTFKPTQNATRYEVVAALANVFNIVTTGNAKTLSDVSAEYKNVVALFTAAGIIDGYTDGTFRGENPIKRSEVAKIICVMMGLDTKNAKDAGFKDVDGWAEEYINACAAAGYVQGKGEGRFAPDEYITRAQLATLINNITGAKAGTSCSYSDVAKDAWYFGAVAAAAK